MIYDMHIYIYMVKRKKRDPPVSPAWSREETLFGVEFNHRFGHPFVLYFSGFGFRFELHFGKVFNHFAIIFRPLCSH